LETVWRRQGLLRVISSDSTSPGPDA
jgi:hypothetical protein